MAKRPNQTKTNQTTTPARGETPNVATVDEAGYTVNLKDLLVRAKEPDFELSEDERRMLQFTYPDLFKEDGTLDLEMLEIVSEEQPTGDETDSEDSEGQPEEELEDDEDTAAALVSLKEIGDEAMSELQQHVEPTEERKLVAVEYPATLLPGDLRAIYQSLNNASRSAINDILVYIDKAGPGAPLTKRELNSYTDKLYGGIVSLLETRQDFNISLTLLLMLFKEFRKKGDRHGALSEYLLYRAEADVEFSPNDRYMFRFLTAALSTLADIKTRSQLLPTVDLKNRLFSITGQCALSVEARNRVVTFFDLDS